MIWSIDATLVGLVGECGVQGESCERNWSYKGIMEEEHRWGLDRVMSTCGEFRKGTYAGEQSAAKGAE